jgi:CRISPR-associated protein Cas1
MANLANTLYVTTPGAFLGRDHENLVVRVEAEEKLRVPIHHVGGVVCFGGTSVSVAALGVLAERGIGVSFLSEGGRFLARVEGPWQGGSLLRKDQYAAAADPARTLAVARACVVGKLVNCRRMLLRSSRDASEEAAALLKHAADSIDRSIKGALRAESVDRARGFEGEGAHVYFGVFSKLIRDGDQGFAMDTRQRRPPRDPLNALLSFLYAVLLHEVTAALLATGLDPAVGFLHRDRPGRPSLGLDLMEELRPAFADRAALALINRKQIKADGFVREEGGAVRMNDSTRKAVLKEWQERRRQIVKHPVTDEEIPLGAVPHVQSRLLARFLRGDLSEYPPYVID